MDRLADADVVQNYLADESGAFRARTEDVTALCLPQTEADIVEIIGTANRDKTLVTISGGGTGITGSRVPMHGGWVLSCERYRTPISINAGAKRASLPPGISLAELDSALPPALIYPPDPTEKSAFLGGSVATNASGARCFNYGPTRNWIEGLRVVLGDGEVLDIRRGDHLAADGNLDLTSESGKNYSLTLPTYKMPDVKNAAGVFSKDDMDSIDLFIGSEGIFGIFTEVRVKLEERPDMVSDIAFFKDSGDALAYADQARSMRDRGLLSLEYFDANSLEFMRSEYPGIMDNLNAAVFTEFKRDGQLLSDISESQARHKACEDWCALTSADARDLKELRHALPEGINTYLREHESYKLGTDFVVPGDRFSEMLDHYQKAGQGYKNRFRREGMHYLLFGHIGDHHLHFNFITHTDEERQAARNLYAELAAKAVELGGTVSGEHGVGKKTIRHEDREIPYLQLMYGEAGLREIARVKKAFDPKGLLNVGNMIPMEYLL